MIAPTRASTMGMKAGILAVSWSNDIQRLSLGTADPRGSANRLPENGLAARAAARNRRVHFHALPR